MLSLVLSVSALSVSALGKADELRRNPFAQPDFGALENTSSTAAARSPDEVITVSAILLDGDASLVSVNGAVIGIGERHAGYELRSVQEESVVFVRGSETITIELYDQRSESDANE